MFECRCRCRDADGEISKWPFKTFRIAIRGFPVLTNNINKLLTERKLSDSLHDK